VVKG
jgi:hypothetical protein